MASRNCFAIMPALHETHKRRAAKLAPTPPDALATAAYEHPYRQHSEQQASRPMTSNLPEPGGAPAISLRLKLSHDFVQKSSFLLEESSQNRRPVKRHTVLSGWLQPL